MKRISRAALAAIALALACVSASAQSYFTTPGGSIANGGVTMCLNGSNLAVPCGTSSNPLQISGTFSASLSGFVPTPAFSQLSASDALSHAVAVPSGADDVIQNTSANDAYCNVGATPTATAANILVPSKSSVPVHNGGAFAEIACISPSSTLAVNIAGGTGLWTGAGGGGGGGGSFPAVVGSNGSTAPTPIQFLTIGGVNGSNVWLPVIMSATQGLKVSLGDVQAGVGTPTATALTVQGNTSGTPLPTNQTQSAGVALGAPTAVGTQGTGNAPNVNATIVGGTVSASFTPFAPNTNSPVTLAVTTSTAQAALPGGGVVKVDNTGTAAAFVNFGTTSGVTATTSNSQIAAGGFQCYAVGSNTNMAAIVASGSTSLNISGGSGGCAGSGGGGGGSSAFPSCCTSGQPGIIAPNSGAIFQVQLNGTNYVSAVPANKVKLAGLTNTIVAIDTNPGVLSSIYCANAGTGWAYVQLFDATTGGASFGTSVPYGIPPGQASGIALPMQGVNFTTAISVAATLTATGSTAPGTALDCTATYN